MKTNNLCQLVFGLLIGFGSLTHAQDAVVRIQLKTLTKPAFDLMGPNGKILSVSELKSQVDKKIDLSTIDPVENKFWQKTQVTQNAIIDADAHAKMPSSDQGVVYTGHAGNIAPLGSYYINVTSSNNPLQVYRLSSGLQVHASLLRAGLLRKIGIHQESPRHYQSIKVKFANMDELKSFIRKAFCTSDPNQPSEPNCLTIDPESRGFLSQVNEAEATLVVHGAYLVKMDAEVPGLFDSLTPADQDTVSVYGQSRAYRSLIAPYIVADAGESINRFSAQSVSVRGGWAQLNYAFSQDFNDSTSYDDVRWILRKMAELTDKDWSDIVDAAAYPQQLRPLVKAKLLLRFKNMMESFFSKEEQARLVRVAMPLLNVSSGDGIVVNGKVMTEKIPGYPQRFSHGERQSPFESADFAKYLKIKVQSMGVEGALNAFSEKLQVMKNTSLDFNGIEVGPGGVRPLVDAGYVTGGVNASANRIITTGTFYGSQAAVQMVDNVTFAVSAGYFHINEGVTGYDTNFGAGVSVIRNYVHVKPIKSLEAAGKVPLKDLYVPSKLRKLTSPLKDGKLTEFLNALDEGEVFTITDSIGVIGQAGISTVLTSLESLISASSLFRPTVGVSVDASRVIMRQIQFVKTAEGLQIYVRNQNSNAFGLEFNVNYFINLLKIRGQSTNMGMNTKAYILNYNAQFLTQVADPSTQVDDATQTKIDSMNTFGNKAALALRALIRDSSVDALDANFTNQKFELDHELKAKELKIKFLWWRSGKFKEEHLLTIKKPELPTEVNGVTVVNQPIRVVTYKKRDMSGEDKFNLGLEVGEALLKMKFKKHVPNLQIGSQNPSQVPFGKAQWTDVRSDTELTQNRKGALPSVSVLEHVWGGWSLNKRDMEKIFSQVREKTSGIDFAGFPLIPTGALATVNKIQFFRVTSHMSFLPEAIAKVKELVPAGTSDKEKLKRMVVTLIRAFGNDNGQKYVDRCYRNSQNTEFIPSWLRGTNVECLEPWVKDFISLAKEYPNDARKSAEYNLREQNKWMTEVIKKLDQNIQLSFLMNYLGPDKFIYYLEVVGFRSGDEDGDDGTYVSNVFGEPLKKAPYANGLISVFADKSKISETELNQTTGGW